MAGGVVVAVRKKIRFQPSPVSQSQSGQIHATVMLLVAKGHMKVDEAFRPLFADTFC